MKPKTTDPKTPQEKVTAALEALVLDIAGFEQEDFHEHMFVLAYSDPTYIPESYSGLVDQDAIRERLDRALFELQPWAGDENDYVFFSTSLVSPFHAKLAAMRVGARIDELCKELFSSIGKPVFNVNEAMFIAFQIGPDSPKFFDAFRYFFSGADDVTDVILDNVTDFMDDFCDSMGIKLKRHENGLLDYDVEYMIDQAMENYNKAQ